MPKVTVVVPTYNRAKWVEEAIQSVLRQSFSDFSLVVVDDGSTDNTKEVVLKFRDPRVKYLYQENRGVSAARNSGVRASTSEYIAFLDSDDMYLDNAIEKSIHAMTQNPSVGFTFGQINIMKSDGKVYSTKKPSFPCSTVVEQTDHVRKMLYYGHITLSTLVVKRSCFEAVGGFNEDLRYFEDYHLCIRLAKRYPAFYIAEPLINYRYHNDQLTRAIKPGGEKAIPLILDEVFKDPDIALKFMHLKGKVYSHMYCTYMFHSVYGVDMKLARYYLRQAIKVYPRVIFTPNIITIFYKYLASMIPKKIGSSLRAFKYRIIYTLKMVKQ
jgi:glycosyltransferase involved in cell wall biosynthesis